MKMDKNAISLLFIIIIFILSITLLVYADTERVDPFDKSVSASVYGNESAPIQFQTFSVNPGDLSIRKVADQIPVACRTYEVTLGASGTPVSGYGNVDVVIVIDRSFSMNSDLNAVENIAKQLVFKINNVTGNQVGIVSLSDLATKHTLNGSFFTNGPTAWNNTINLLTSGGASNVAAGIKAAKEILLTSSRYGNPNVNQAIVVLSDGIATTTLTGNATDAYVASDYTTAYNNAVSEAQSAELSNIIVYAVNTSATTPVNEKTYGTQMMTAIGIDGNTNIQSYSGDPKTDGTIVYDAISTHVFSSASNGVVTDTINPKFEFVSFVSYSPRTSAPTVATAGGNQVITWNIGSIIEEEKVLKYQIRAKLEYPSGTPVVGIVPTNTNAYLAFTPAPSSTSVSPMYFPQPDVYVASPLSVTLTDATTVIGASITLGTATSPTNGNYMKPTGGWYVDSEIFSLFPGRFSTTIPQVLTYQWYLASDINMTTPINPNVTLVKDTQFLVKVTDAYGCIATATIWVRPRGTLTITKNIVGEINQDQSFIFEIKQYNDTNKNNLVKTFYETIRGSGLYNSRVILNLPQGYYEVNEKCDWSWQYSPVGSTISGDTLGINTDGTDNYNKSQAFVAFTDQSKAITWITYSDSVTNLFTGRGQ